MADDFDSPPVNGDRSGDASGVDLRRYWFIVRRRLWLVVAVIACALGAAVFYTSRQPNRYRAAATVVVHNQPAQVLGKQISGFDAESASWWQGTTFLRTQLEILKSRRISRLAAEKLKPELLSRLLGKKRGAALTDRDLRRAGDHIFGVKRVVPGKESRKFTVIVEHTDPVLAAEVANAIVDAFVDYSLAQRRNSSTVAEGWLGERLDQLEDTLKESEEKLQRFRKDNGLLSVSLQGRLSEVSNTIIALMTKRNELRSERIVLGAKIGQLKRLKFDDPAKDPLVNISTNQVIEGLKASYVKEYATLTELRRRYLEKHPKITAQEAVVGSIRKDIQREARLVLEQLSAKHRALIDAEGRIRALLQKAEKKGMALGAKSLNFRRLERKAKQAAKYYELVMSRYTESGLAKQLETNNVAVLDRARVPGAPFSPRLSFNLIIALVLGLMAGLGLAFLLFFMDNTVKTQEDVEGLVGLPFLGYLPTMRDGVKNGRGKAAAPGPNGQTFSPDLYLHHNPKSQVAEHCRSIRTNLLFMSPDRPLRALLVTSAAPREGKTTVAINIATSMAMGGERTLLVDTDMRRPRVSKAFGIRRREGMATVLVGESKLDDVIVETGIDNLYCLPCGRIPPNPAELLHSKAFQELYGELLERFDRIIFDSPPIGAVTDPVILSKTVDGTLLVVKTGVTVRQMLSQAGRALSDVKAKVLGCVLNDVDPERRGGYGGAYYYYYSRRRGYSYYGESNAE